MSHRVYEQGERHILNTYFQDVAFSGPFYVGLGTGPIPPNETDTLSDITEVTGTNYSRLSVNRDGTPSGWSVSGDEASAAELEWQNLSPDTCWTPADYAFLTLSSGGTTAPDVLIAAVDLGTPIILDPQERMKVIFRFRQL